MGHVAYVAQIDLANQTVFLVSDNYAGGVNGYTSNSWVPINQPTGYIHLRDQPTVVAQVKRQRLPMRP
jgi:hypothetical protein